MNKTAIKNFAIWARNKLIADVKYRAGLMGITESGISGALPQSTGTTEFYDIGTLQPYTISGDEIKQRNRLVETLRQKEAGSDYATAYKYILEEVAYTWFNRLIAVRFMEINDYLPSHVRVLSSETGKQEPDLVTNPFDADIDFTEKEKVQILGLKQENKLDELFRMLFIKQCNALNEILPALFETTNDYTELLLNISYIDQDGVVSHLVKDIEEEDFNVEKGGQVEIIGWLYQYYNTEPKNEAFAKSGKITKEEIPAVTQLFTPDWIVRYMVENSLGRLWLEGHPNDSLKRQWKYYLDDAEQEPSVQAELDEIKREHAKLNPEDIRLIDPCMGSGHILVYAFDVFMQIYDAAGWTQRDAAESILKNNIFGLDIDDRAGQMAYFAVMMKARQYNRRILSRDIAYNVYAIQDSNGIKTSAFEHMGQALSEEEHAKAIKEATKLVEEFHDAKEYGSIIDVQNHDWELLKRFATAYRDDSGQAMLDIYGDQEAAARLSVLNRIGDILACHYDVVITNPPYMAIANASNKMSQYVADYYPESKTDLFAVFIEKGLAFLKSKGYMSMITQHAWMFLGSYEKLRNKLYDHTIVSMNHLGARAFEEIAGEVVQTTAFVYQNDFVCGYKGNYVRLVDYSSQNEKELAYRTIDACRYCADQDSFKKIPGSPVAYWASDSLLRIFDGHKTIGDMFKTITGSSTSDNLKFLKMWQEVSISSVGIDISEEYDGHGYKWIPCNKGGSFRKWYGNHEYVINWDNDGVELKAFATMKNNGKHWSRFLKSLDCFYKPGVVWSKISTGSFSARYMPAGFIMESAACAIMPEKGKIPYILGLMNTKIAQSVLYIKNPTINIQAGDITSIPIITGIKDYEVEQLVEQNIEIEKEDWDSFETSWDFLIHPLIRNAKGCLISEKYEDWESECSQRYLKLKRNEESLNSIFIDIYGLQDEITPDINEKEITVHRAELVRDIKSLLSYAVGCMFGRYSIDVEGLVYAGGEWIMENYSSFIPDHDNVIPITDEEYLEDDIVTRLCIWLSAVYGEENLEENLGFIAKVLGNKGATSREVIRSYFINDFYKDHCQTYSVSGSGKRPIYWLFDSGKQNGFKALVYLHRYTADTIGNLRVDYLHRMQRVYESEINRMQDMIDHSTNSREVTAATRRKEKLIKQLKECRDYDELIGHLALERTELDLDDGVKYNYRKLQTGSDGKLYEVLADSKNIMMDAKKYADFKK